MAKLDKGNGLQTLGNYKFYWDPDEMTMPYSEKIVAEEKTFGGSQIFEWEATIIGKEVNLKWDFMPLGMYNNLRRKYMRLGQTYTWDPQLTNGETFSVAITGLQGTYFKHLKENSTWRKDVILTLSIRSKVVSATTTTTSTTTSSTSTT